MKSELFEFAMPKFLQKITDIDVIAIYSYPMCILIGGICAVYFLKKKESDEDFYFFTTPLLIIIIMSAFLGGKLFLFLEKPFYFVSNPKHVADLVSSGYVFYGSFLVSIISIAFYLKINDKPLLKSFDLIALSVVILHAFGRLGCFLAGCCYGKPSEFGVVFPKTFPNKVHPTQLYEVIVLIVTFIILNKAYRTKKRSGIVFLLYIICYATGRIIIECFRGDSRGYILGHTFSHSQIIGAVLVIITLIFFKIKSREWRKFTH